MQRLVSRHTWIILLAFVAGVLLFKPLYAQDTGGAITNTATLSQSVQVASGPAEWKVLATGADADGYTRWRLDVNSVCQYSDHDYALTLPEDPARMADIRLTMSNFDVDYFDPQECVGGPEFDNADLNGNTLGILGGANESWSINSWSIDRNRLVKGPNRISIDTDATGTGCWCVAVGYIELQAKVGFQVVETTPADKEPDRDFHADKLDLTVTFSTDVDATTVNNDTFALLFKDQAGAMQEVPGTFTLLGTNKFRFEPSADLLDGVRYYAIVNSGKSGVKSAGGIELAGAFTWSFWTVPDLKVTDTFDYGDGAGSRCRPASVPCDGLEVAVFQVARNATMIPNKDSVARVYLRWKRHPNVAASDQLKELTVDVDMNVTPGGGIYGAIGTVKRPDQYSAAEIIAAANSINIYHKPPAGFNYTLEVTPQPQANTTPVFFTANKSLANAGKSPTITFNHYFLKDGEWSGGAPSAVRSGALALLLNGSQVTLDMFPAVAVNAVNKGDISFGYSYTGAKVNRDACGMVKEVMCPIGATTVKMPEPDCVNSKMLPLLGSSKLVAITIPQSVCPNVGGVAFGQILLLPPTNNAVAVAHEIGHAFDISTANNPNDGHRNSPDGIEGFQVRTKVNRSQVENPTQALSLMHTGPIADPSAQWIHNDDYAALFGTVTVAEVATLSEVAPSALESGAADEADETVIAEQYLLVAGLLDVGASSAQIEPLSLQDVATAAPPTGTCLAELLDGSSAVLASVAFAPGVTVAGWRNSDVEQEESFSTESTEASGPQPFALTLGWNESAQQVKISCGGAPITTINRSAIAPSADFSDLTEGATLSGNVTVNWTGSDGDSADLFYQIQFSADGAQWTPLTSLATATSATIDTTTLTSGNQRKIRLLVSDGFNSVYVVRNVQIANDLAVLAESPEEYAEGVSLFATMQASFSTPIDPTTLSFATFSIAGGSQPPTGTLTLSADQRVVSFQPSEALQPLTYYTVSVRKELKDIAGHSLPYDQVWSFRTISDTTPPLIVRIDPAEGESDAPINAFITVHLNEELDFGSTTDAITVVDSANRPVEGTTTYYDRDLNLVFIPKANLAAHTTYKVTVPTTVKDYQGNALAKAYVWSFTTGETTSTQTRIVGNYGELAEDVDGDGLYDNLTVYVDVQSTTGYYNLNARLVDKSGALIQWTKAELGADFLAGLLNPGLHRFALVFDGRVIRAHQVNGPYLIDSLNFYDDNAPFDGDIRFEAFQTLPYAVDAFAGLLSFKPLPDRSLPWNTTLDNAWKLRDYTNSISESVTSVTYSIIGNSDPRVGVSIDADSFVDIHPDPNVEAESTVTIEARDSLGHRDQGSFSVKVQKPVATFLIVPQLLIVAPEETVTIEVEIHDQFDHLFSGEAVTLNFSNVLGTATVSPESATTSTGRASFTYSPGPEEGSDSIFIQGEAGSGLVTQIEVTIKANSIFLPKVDNVR